ncbi:phosphoglucomutase [Candida albicans P57072]|uniref:phosphoglucomutase (alpha-D-glucose-1,6-bisphosphate-dependent) n=4 Tax=Candida albicans TaxID=5476 RepID=A0A1D8PSA9_CANAL|nr:phosphoglucomutase [Candida albicans SC5314]EEQ43384.1 phosphoglucomutase [Candida albicans WO-1]KGQ81615.1 phosphoglucomutase [Candida albicans P94015]KGQ82879.1 phosphoglucomutase [Candida albicans P37005]KGQ83244.1 phosphoglucomutase [Candida albicans GC75]KGR01756.1 phosphoglucomutase [Candida albicans P57072]KGR04523.1 phosphoglucomutase [Candida albicans P78048]KGR06565.1 phosphoglucomutase [Candida albicans P37037]KGT64379.1 phosphoglucomutase [Candida albicans 12C]KGU02114.1 pho|eukprot:XP_715772.2 phosphoglucomutase [Candida albicans SC5314]
MSELSIKTIETKPFQDQKPGTSGLRKKVTVFQQPHYTENFIQSILDAIPEGSQGSTLVIGGDGRFYNDVVIQLIIKIAAANGVKKLILGQNGILSTPATSHVIRIKQATGGIILTASHNPGGPQNDLGIKYNLGNGGPAPESVTNKIYEISKQINQYKLIELPNVDLSKIGTIVEGPIEIEIIDSTKDYVDMLKSIFDFPLIKSFIDKATKEQDFKVLFDALNGVTGPYGYEIFVNELGLPESSIQNYKPLPDFGGLHPDPNLTYAHTLVERVDKENIAFGAASDGDGDRNMIYGAGTFVSPGDSVAIISEYADSIPYFQKQGVYGLARSMPTSGAIDLVAANKNLQCYEVPTGWKFFCSLFDAKKLSICGEESFGTGSNHIREKDGLWAIVAWLNVLAGYNKQNPQSKTSIEIVQNSFWEKYGRTFFTRYDYENVSSEGAQKLIDLLQSIVNEKSVGDELAPGYIIKQADNFSYTDLDGSVSSNQGLFIKFDNGLRFIVRLSGTGSSGATVRLYLEKHCDDKSKYHLKVDEYLTNEIQFVLELLKFKQFLNKEEPDVRT